MWLELHKPELNEESAAPATLFRTGNDVRAIARKVYDPETKGTLVDVRAERYDEGLGRSRILFATVKPIFEASFSLAEALAFGTAIGTIRKLKAG